MAWKEMTLAELARSLGADLAEVREKQRLMEMIIKIRKAKKMSQAALAKKLGVTQSRVAQIECGIGTSKVTFDVLFHILTSLGYDYKVLINGDANN
jgi:transcriptional regulator with XRE-family HTH domain